jgi:N-acetyltransferase
VFDFQPQLTGDLLIMRPATAGDHDALFAIGSDPLVWELHPEEDRYQESVFRSYFEDGLASGGALVAICRATGEVAGWSRYSTEYVQPGEVEIGWTFLGRAYWGGAYNRDMKNVMLQHAFRFADRVIFRVGEKNLRSRRAVEKLGATLTDRTQTTTARGSTFVSLFYALSRNERSPRTVFVDVDDTIVRSVGAKRIPIPSVVAEIRRLKEDGATLYLWSSGGAAYCQRTAVELGIADCFDGFLPKPNVYIDDQAVSEWRYCRHVYPPQAGDVFP